MFTRVCPLYTRVRLACTLYLPNVVSHVYVVFGQLHRCHLYDITYEYLYINIILHICYACIGLQTETDCHNRARSTVKSKVCKKPLTCAVKLLNKSLLYSLKNIYARFASISTRIYWNFIFCLKLYSIY